MRVAQGVRHRRDDDDDGKAVQTSSTDLIDPPRSDGEPTFNEGFVFNGDGSLIPARVVEAPWLTRLQPVGEGVSLVLETPSGTVRIEGDTILSTHDIHHDDKMFSTQALKQETPSFPALQQAGVRYRWGGEQTFGMLERSNPLDKITRHVAG